MKKSGKKPEAHDLLLNQKQPIQTIPVNTAPVSVHGKKVFDRSYNRAGDRRVAVTMAPEGKFKGGKSRHPVKEIGFGPTGLNDLGS